VLNLDSAFLLGKTAMIIASTNIILDILVLIDTNNPQTTIKTKTQ
jgi:hypothetical protein